MDDRLKKLDSIFDDEEEQIIEEEAYGFEEGAKKGKRLSNSIYETLTETEVDVDEETDSESGELTEEERFIQRMKEKRETAKMNEELLFSHHEDPRFVSKTKIKNTREAYTIALIKTIAEETGDELTMKVLRNLASTLIAVDAKALDMFVSITKEDQREIDREAMDVQSDSWVKRMFGGGSDVEK